MVAIRSNNFETREQNEDKNDNKNQIKRTTYRTIKKKKWNSSTQLVFSLLLWFITSDRFADAAPQLRGDRGLVENEDVLGSFGTNDTLTETPNLQLYSKVTIQNDTPYPAYDTYVEYSVGGVTDSIHEGIVSGYKWTGPTRGLALVVKIYATLRTRPEARQRRLQLDDWSRLDDDYSDPYEHGDKACNPYLSIGTTHADYFIILMGDVCCVRSSYQTKECPWNSKYEKVIINLDVYTK